MENVALITGIAGIVLSFFSIIILILTRKSILDILNKDSLIFDKNFEIKEKWMVETLNLIDSVETQGQAITSNPEFSKRAKICYNHLICVITNMQLSDEFFDICFNPSANITTDRLKNFKLSCRKDIGFKVKLNKKHK